MLSEINTCRKRLERIEADPTLRFSGARWRAHEAVYPGSGAAEYAERYRERDAETLAEIEAALAEFEAKCPGDESAAYLRWLRDELAAGEGDEQLVLEMAA